MGRLFENCFRADADAPVVGHGFPDELPPGIEEEYGGPGDIIPLETAANMSNSELVDEAKGGIRKEREIEFHPGRELAVGVNAVGTDHDHPGVTLAELPADRLQTLQLRDAEGSPESTVEDQEEMLACQLVEPKGLTMLVGRRKVGERVDGIGRLGESGNLVGEVTDVSEK